MYFNDKAFKKCKTPGFTSNYYDLETGEDYWISGIKKNGQDRHWAGAGKIMIDKDVVNKYLEIIEEQQLSKARYEIIHGQKF